MKGLEKFIGLGMTVLLAGCMSQHTRMPTLAYGDPSMERRSYEYHNPLPERESGRAIEAPRGFEFDRSEPRRAIQRAGAPGGFTPDGSSGLSPSASRYSQSVTP